MHNICLGLVPNYASDLHALMYHLSNVLFYSVGRNSKGKIDLTETSLDTLDNKV